MALVWLSVPQMSRMFFADMNTFPVTVRPGSGVEAPRVDALITICSYDVITTQRSRHTRVSIARSDPLTARLQSLFADDARSSHGLQLDPLCCVRIAAPPQRFTPR